MRKNILYILAALALIGCGSKESTATQEEERVEQVRTTVLQPREIEREISVSTNLQGYLTQNVAPSLTGRSRPRPHGPDTVQDHENLIG